MQHHILLTIGQIAKRLRCPTHRVRYTIETRGIKPAAWAGRTKVFTEHQVAQIQAEMKRIEAEGRGVTVL